MAKESNTIIIYAAKCNIDGVKKEHLTRSLEDAKSYLDKWNIEPSMVEMRKDHECNIYGSLDDIKNYDGSTPYAWCSQIAQDDTDYFISFKIQRYKVK